jgi:hypothetical protein
MAEQFKRQRLDADCEGGPADALTIISKLVDQTIRDAAEKAHLLAKIRSLEEECTKHAYNAQRVNALEAKLRATTTTYEEKIADMHRHASLDVRNAKTKETQLRQMIDSQVHEMRRLQEEAALQLQSLTKVHEREITDLHKMLTSKAPAPSVKPEQIVL